MMTSRIREFFRSASARGCKRGRAGKLIAWKICAVFLLCAGTAIAAPAQTYTILALSAPPDNFGQGNLVQGTDGNFYVVGSFDAVLKVTRAGALTTLASFPQGSSANSLLLGTDGNFYGTTMYGGAYGYGTIFKITPAGALTTLYSFCAQSGCTDGSGPSGLFEGTDGNFYGTAASGGVYNVLCNGGTCGTLFRLTPGGAFTTMYALCSLPNCTDGATPSGLIQAADGNFYGSTTGGGLNTGPGCNTWEWSLTHCGTIFRITPSGTLTTLYNFCSQANCADGIQPSGLVEAADGNFYGVTAAWLIPDGIGLYGTVFKIAPSSALTTLNDGVAPSLNGTLIQATDHNFYSTMPRGGYSIGYGTILQITPTGSLIDLIDLGSGLGEFPYDRLLQSTDGNIYGTTWDGAGYSQRRCRPFPAASCGVFFRLSVGLASFVSFIRNSGAVGATAQILGQGFTGTSSVSFDGIPASFTIESDTYLTATVPAGATTAPVIVTTPSGTLKSNQLFRVTPQIFSFSPENGPVGTSVVITGESFTGANDVLIGCDSNQTPMSFTVDSDTQITAIVPAGAVSGKIGVKTRGGTVSSATGFGITN